MFIKPCKGRVTSHYNLKRKHPISGKVRPHVGTDFGSHVDNYIIAAAGGRVTRATYINGYGNVIYIDHKINGVNYQTRYAHLKSFNVKYNQVVKQGQRIGLKGTTGDSTGVHLHFEIRKNGLTVDPFGYINNLVVDGYEGKETIKAEQRYWGTPVDGVISKPSLMIKKRQALLGVKVDGYAGKITIKAEQKRYGTPEDGVISKPSTMIRERQRRLNRGKL